MQSWFTFELDGETVRVEREDTHRSLASFLAGLDPCFRRFAYHDAWQGGDLVVLGDLEGDRHRFRAVDAGLMLLPMLADRQVWTPEGILTAEPDHPVNLALQSGHFECSAERLGAIRVLMFEGYYRPDLRRQGQTNDQFDAIVTRTANVPAIREAAAQVFASAGQLRHEAASRAERSGSEATVWTGRKDIFGDFFTRRLFQLKERKSLNFVDAFKKRFHLPASMVELLRLKREYPDSRLVAGGIDRVNSSRTGEFSSLISLEGVKEMNLMHTSEEAWEVGSAIPLTRISEHIGRECPAFSKLMRRFASRPIRNRATIGGYLAAGRPDGQLAPLLMAMNARVMLISEEGERDAPVSQFYDEKGNSILAAGEIIRTVVLPRLTESVLSARGITSCLVDAYTVAPRRNLCESFVTAAFALELRERTVAKARIAYSGIGPAPVRAREAEEFLVGKSWGEKTVFETLPVLNKTVEVTGPADGAGGLDFRRQLVVTLFQKFCAQHPDFDSTRPVELTAAGEFTQFDQPYYNIVPF